MSAQDQLEIINAQGDVRFYSLNTGAGITNIGRHPDNDIVIESPEVAPFHAVLDHQQKPYRIVALSSESRIKVSGQILQPNAPRELHNWDTIELDGYSIILLESGAAVPGAAPSIAPLPYPLYPTPLPAILPVEPVPAAASFGAAATVPSPDAPIEIHDLDELDRLLASIPEDRVDDLIMVEPIAQMNAMDPAHPNALDFSVEVDQSATLQVTIVNGGDLVSEFLVEVRGVDPGWVAILPRSINLNDGDRGAVSIAITPPRLSSTRAKAHYFAIVVTSPSYPGRMSSTTGMLVVRPFYEYAVGDIDPKKLKVSWSKRVGQAAISIANRGNSDAPFHLSGEDDHHAANIEFDSPEEGLKLEGQIQFHVPPEQTIAIPIFITPRKRPIVGVGGQDINYTVSVTPLAGETQTPRTVLGQARSLPLIGPLPIVLLVILFALLVILIFRPWIAEFKPDVKAIESGQSVTLSWRASPLASLRIEPDVGKVEGPEGSVALSPLDDVTYTLKAETFLTRLLPQWFTAAADVRIIVDPVLPKVEFRVDRDSILSGEKVVLSWEVQAQQPAQVILTVNGAPETILPDEYIGSRPFVLERDTTFTLKVSNRYTPPEGQTASLAVRVTVPSPTPRPLPVIERFDVTPLEITAGESVTVSWAVSGTDKVKIEGIGELPPSGSISAKPAASIAYVLTASNGQQEVSSLVKQVIVNPAPTPTPLPGTPKIEFFTASPSEVAIGSPESKSITLSWSVIGDVTNVEVSGPDFGRAAGLDKKGTLNVSATKTTLFILTAFNGTLTASQTVQVKVSAPVPVITSISPASTTAGDPDFTLIINGRNFISGSIVRWEGANRPTTYVSGTMLKASIPASNIAGAGTYKVTVFNPAPGGGTSGVANFSVSNPNPTISAIAPSQATAGDLGFTLIVTGSGFTPTSKVRWNGADLPTAYVNNLQLTASVSDAELATAGTVSVTVFNPTPGGGTSGSATFTILAQSPQPVLIGTNPMTTTITTLDLPIIVTGSDFSSRAQVKLNGAGLNTTFQDNTTLFATIPASKLGAPRTYKITVENPTPCSPSCTSSAVDFTVTYPAPTIDPIIPFTIGGFNRPVVAGGPSFTLEVNGTNFITGTTGTIVDWVVGATSSRRTITSSSATLLRVTILSGDIASAGTSASIRVTNPDGQTASRTLNIITPVVVVTPTSTSIDLGASTTITVTLEDGLGNSAAQLIPRQINLSSSAPSLALLPSSTISTTGAGNASGTFTVSGAGAVSSATVTAKLQGFGLPEPQAVATVTVNNPIPAILTINPGSGQTSSGFTLTINSTGSNFATGATVQWNGVNTTNTPTVTPTTITVGITVAEVGGSSGTKTVRVTNPGPCTGVCTSNQMTFTVNNSAPAIASISPGSGQTSTAVPLTINSTGSNFVTGATVQWNGLNTTNAPTVAASTITVNITAAEVGSTLGTRTVTVTNPGTCTGGTCVSNSQTFIVNNAAPGIASISPTSGAINTGFTLTINSTGSNFVNGATVQWNGSNTANTPTVTASTITVDINPAEVGGSSGAKTVTVTNPGSCTGGSCVSNSQTFTVTNPAPTITSMNPTSSVYSSPITLIINSAAGNFVNGATVQWNGVSTTTAPLVTSTVITATITSAEVATAGAGTRTVTVTNPGTCTPSCVSSSQNFTVNKAATSTAVTSSDADNTTLYGQSVTFTATVTNTSGTNVAPQGSVTFTADGSNITGCVGVSLTATGLNTATATCNVTTQLNVSGSPYDVTAAYTASPANFTDSSDPSPIVHTINPDLQLSAPSPTSIQVGGGADNSSESLFTVTLASGGSLGSAQTINLTTSNGSVLGFTNCSNTTLITSVPTTGPSFTTATFCAVGLGAGTATVTATLAGLGNDSQTSIAILVNNPTINISPSSVNLNNGNTTDTLTVTISAAQATNTIISLSSNNTSIATVPASVTILANQTTATFTVTRGATTGTTTVRGQLPSGLGSGFSNNVTVNNN